MIGQSFLMGAEYTWAMLLILTNFVTNPIKYKWPYNISF